MRHFTGARTGTVGACSPAGAAVGNVPVIGTPIGPTGMYTTVWFGEPTISFCRLQLADGVS